MVFFVGGLNFETINAIMIRDMLAPNGRHGKPLLHAFGNAEMIKAICEITSGEIDGHSTVGFNTAERAGFWKMG